MAFEVRTLPNFEKEVKRLLKKYPSLKKDLLQLINRLETNPIQGDSLGNDFYKIRLAISSKGKGKSGGGRVITCVKVIKSIVYLAAIYDKSVRESISNEELRFLAKQIPL